MVSSIQSVEGIQGVNILPRAQASHRPGSETRWREATHVRSRVEHVSRVGIEPRKWCESRGPARDNHARRPEPRGGNRGQAHAAGTPSLPRRSRRDRAEATGVGGQSMLIKGAHGNACEPHRPPVSASAEQCGAAHAAGRPPRAHSSPRQGPPPRRVDPHRTTRGRQGRRDTRERAGTPEGREAVVAEQRSAGSNGSHSPRTRAHLRASPAGRAVRAGGREAGQPGHHDRPGDLGQRRRSRASSPHPGRTGARASEPGARPAAPGTARSSGPAVSRQGVHHARPSPGGGAAGPGVWAPHPASCPWGGPGPMAGVPGHPGNQPGGMTRETRQRNGRSATGGAPTAPHKPRHAATARAAGPGGPDRGPGRGDAAGGARRAGLLRGLRRVPPGPQPAARPACGTPGRAHKRDGLWERLGQQRLLRPWAARHAGKDAAPAEQGRPGAGADREGAARGPPGREGEGVPGHRPPARVGALAAVSQGGRARGARPMG